VELLQHINPLFVMSGLAVGAIVGLTGVGGGSLMTPILILLFGIHPAAAVGTDLLYASVTKTGGSLIHGFNRTIHWPLVARLALGSVPAALLTLLALQHFESEAAALNALITRALGFALILTAATIIFRKRLIDRYAEKLEALGEKRIHALTTLTGAALGVLVTLSSVGAGALGVTALLLLYPKMPVARIVGSDIAHAVPLTLIAGAGHLMMGHIDVAMLTSLLLGSLPGIMLASNLAPRLPENFLRYALSTILVVVSAKLLA
jgi:uncharacterized membrane protein YfcA